MKLIGILCLGIAACVPLAGGQVYMTNEGGQPFTNVPTTGFTHLDSVQVLQPNQTISQSYSYGSYSASYAGYLSFGHLGLAMSTDVTCGAGCGGHSQQNRFRIYSSDNLTVGGVSSGILRLQYRFDGSMQLTGSGAINTNSWVQAGFSLAGVSAASFGNGTSVESVTIGGTLTETSPGNWNYLAEGFANLVIASGRVLLTQELFGIANCYAGPNQSCTASLDFLNSAIVGGAVVYDSSGNVVQNATVDGQSGYDYTRALPSLVPEPAHYASLAIAFIGLLAAIRRRQPARIRE